ncbi:hypothetical protein OXYTRIMIC_069 [Oxytricha trifallax]|uniref:Uncharacterized protein n=1 Tax=Oxytricha trifallax TaxID=1172189 RepID=A0A073HZF4_9SPIT|nr:hypothetical protein OXYTRIMIC_069 [Oxytricha trifallax]
MDFSTNYDDQLKAQILFSHYSIEKLLQKGDSEAVQEIIDGSKNVRRYSSLQVAQRLNELNDVLVVKQKELETAKAEGNVQAIDQLKDDIIKIQTAALKIHALKI